MLNAIPLSLAALIAVGIIDPCILSGMPLTDLWRVKDGKLIEHWDEFNLLEVFQQIAAATVRKAEGQ